MRAASLRRPWFVLLAVAALTAAASIALALQPSGRTVRGHPTVLHDYRPQPGRTFFWGTSARAPFTAAQLDAMARSRGIVVIAASLDNYNLAEQEAAARALHARNPHVRVLFYLNTKHYFDENLHPHYLHGFDPQTMALHGADGAPVLFGSTAQRPGGIGYYVDEASAAWRAFYLATAKQVLTAGDFDGIAMDSMRPLTAATDPRAVAAVSPAQVSAWDAGQLQLLQEVRAALPGELVAYNGISQTVPGQTDRDLGPFAVADAALNEHFCLEHGAPDAAAIRADLAVMAEAAARHKIVLEKVNYPQGSTSRYGDFCVGAFLLGWAPGSTYFDFSDGYGIDQLETQPAHLDLELGRPTAPASFVGDVGTRTFRHGRVSVDLATGQATFAGR
jgi:hypothetical protein